MAAGGFVVTREATKLALDRDGASHPLIARDLRTGARRWTFVREDVRRNDGSPIASTDLPDRGYVRAVSGVHVLLEEGKQLVCRILSEPGAIAWKLPLPPHDSLTITDENILLRTPSALQIYRAR